ncbi:Uncharacterised protein [Dermatophilus congolensis]|uniref:Uncharacterized protein n=1 Tax=Dermatophilus congolensis TaxID=1863 RepID=A0AA46GZF7_9MICO|nr:Uncharacterised protein [Dermatophilus congolensis]
MGVGSGVALAVGDACFECGDDVGCGVAFVGADVLFNPWAGRGLLPAFCGCIDWRVRFDVYAADVHAVAAGVSGGSDVPSHG